MREATQRERKFIELVIAGMPDFTAARLAGYSRAMARNTAWKIWKKRSVAEYFTRVIEQSAPPPQVVAAISRMIDSRDPKVSFKAIELALRLQGIDPGALVDEPWSTRRRRLLAPDQAATAKE